MKQHAQIVQHIVWSTAGRICYIGGCVLRSRDGARIIASQ